MEIVRHENWSEREPLVSVVMIAYNHERYVEQAIESVLSQRTDFDFEVIVHDDASTDATAEIARRYAESDPRVTAVLQTENQYSRKVPISMFTLPLCRGKYVSYCECDDFWTDERKLRLEVGYLENNPDCSAVYCNSTIVDEIGEPSPELAKKMRSYSVHPECDYPLEKFAKAGVFPGQTATLVIRRSLYDGMSEEDRVDFASLRMCGDRKSYLLAAVSGRVHVLSQVMSAYRVVFEGGSWTARTNGLNLSGSSFLGEIDARRFCLTHGCRYPNAWFRGKKGLRALVACATSPTPENREQAQMVLGAYRNGVACALSIAGALLTGFFPALFRKAAGAVRGSVTRRD